MKGILIVDMPHCMCRQCIFLESMTLNHIVQYWCGAERLTIENPNVIQDFCPLRPLPKKKEIRCPVEDGLITTTDVLEYSLEDYLFDKGYNKAIDEITGESEDDNSL